MEEPAITNHPGGVPELEHHLRWNNSANVLCKYMEKPEFLHMILKNQAIIPRYVTEPLEYLDIKELHAICFPMTCFCDIPFSRVAMHMSEYGEYGIGLDKEAVLRNYRIQPVHYINDKSPLADDFREAFRLFYGSDEELQGGARTLLNYMLSTLLYMKPVWGFEAEQENSIRIYQDECEWRYIPSDHFPEGLPLILPKAETTETGKQTYSRVLEKHPECWLRFAWRDVKYIMVPDEAAAEDMIRIILALDLSSDVRYKLISKIELSNQFPYNM